MNIETKYKQLPIIDITSDIFFKLNSNINEEYIKSLVGKHIYFKFLLDDGIIDIQGRLLSYKDNQLLVKRFDDDTKILEETCFEENYPIQNIKGIEEYKSNNSLEFKDEYKNAICKLTNIYGNSIIVYIDDIDFSNVISFKYKYKEHDTILIGENDYPLYLLKSIEII